MSDVPVGVLLLPGSLGTVIWLQDTISSSIVAWFTWNNHVATEYHIIISCCLVHLEQSRGYRIPYHHQLLPGSFGTITWLQDTISSSVVAWFTWNNHMATGYHIIINCCLVHLEQSRGYRIPYHHQLLPGSLGTSQFTNIKACTEIFLLELCI